MALSKLNHPNIETVYDFDTQDGVDFLVMEYVPGQTLDDRLVGGALSEKETLRLGLQLVDGLSAAHERGVIHRDLKPGNLIVTPEGRLKILDFGLAKLVQTASQSATTQSDESAPAGTFPYMAPEQLCSETVDARTDIYALGNMLYEMASGKRPFRDETAPRLTDAILHRTPASLRTLNARISSRLDEIIFKCLEKDPENRYQAARELMVDLRRLAAPSAPPAVRKRSVWAVAIPALALGALMLLIVLAAFNIGGLRDRLLQPAAPSRLSVAVLPLKNLSGDPSQEGFSDGITAEIISHLARIPGLKVISRTSAEQYKNTAKNLREIAHELGVDAVLEGTLRRDVNRIRITAQLIDADTDAHLWAESYDRELSGVFEVQSDVATQIATALRANLSPSVKQQFDKKPTTNIEAYELYLRGIQFAELGDEERRIRASIQLYEEAINKDPAFALAYAGLSEAQSRMWWYHWDRTIDRVASAKAAVDRALQLQPELAEAHRALGHYYYMCHLDYSRALEHFEIALQAKPGDSLTVAVIGYAKRRQGKIPEALTALLQSLQLDPHQPLQIFNTGETFALLRNPKEADQYYERALMLNPDYNRPYAYKLRLRFRLMKDIPGGREVFEKARAAGLGKNPFIAYQKVLLEMSAGDYQAALSVLSSSQAEALDEQFWYLPKSLVEAQIRALMKQPDQARAQYEAARNILERKIHEIPEDSRYYSSLGIALAGLAVKEDAIRAGERGIELLPVSKEAYRGAYRVEDLARIYAMAGERDAAIDQLEYLMSIPLDLGVAALELDPAWTPLRDHPRFQALIRRYSSQ